MRPRAEEVNKSLQLQDWEGYKKDAKTNMIVVLHTDLA